MTEQWQELKETITEMRDNDGTSTQQEICKFLANYMDVLEKQMRRPTPEERESVDKYVKSISKPTGVDFWDLEQKPCEDAISRAEALRHSFQIYDDDGFGYKVIYADKIKQLPSVKPQEKTGHWTEDEYEMEVRCSACGEENDECSRYCPNCGAKMVQESEE